MEYVQTIQTTADRGQAWAALAAVTTYPQWTPSMTAVTALDGAELAVGHRFQVKQPGLPPTVWRVSQVRDGESFSWEARSPGVRTVAFHRLSANPDGGTQITIGLHQTGVLAGLMRLLIGARTRRYLALEASGLKASAEAASAAPV